MEKENKKETLDEAISNAIDEVDQAVRKHGKEIFDRAIEKVVETISYMWSIEKAKIKYKIVKGIRDGRKSKEDL
jgi:flagellar hook-basal body complex protein FliE